MPVFRVERNTGYTVMSNHHLRNKSLSLKAKGLLSQMLSLPEDWDYTLAGLSIINREKIDAVREAVKELEKEGYIVRSRQRDEKGCLRGADYIIYEQPQLPTSDLPTLENPILDNPTLENPTLENPTLENPTLENPTQLNKDINIKDSKNKDGSITDSLPFPSPNPSPCESRPKGKKRLQEIAVLKTQIINYVKTRETYIAYRKAGYSKKFLEKHEGEIILHKAAKKYFDEKGLKKLPSIKSLNAEYAELLKEKKSAYIKYRKAREKMQDL